MTRLAPGATVLDERLSVVSGLAATFTRTAKVSNIAMTPSPKATRFTGKRRFLDGPAPGGTMSAGTTVGGASGLISDDGGAGAAGPIFASGTVESTADETSGRVLRMPGSLLLPVRVAASASVNAAPLGHLAAGSLARPRMTTASTPGLSSGVRELGLGGSRWTCAYSSSRSPSPSKGITPVNISEATLARAYRAPGRPAGRPVTLPGGHYP